MVVNAEKIQKQLSDPIRKQYIKPLSKPLSLRPYQQELVDEILTHIQVGNQNIMAVLATGGGKSICFKFIARYLAELGYNVLLIVPKKELMRQGANHMKNAGLVPSIIHENYKKQTRYASPVQVSTVASFYNRMNKISWKPDVVMYDEAHHQHEDTVTWSNIKANYSEAFHIGFTATPILTNGKGFDKLFDVMVTGPGVSDLESEGFLCPAKIYGALPINTKNIRRATNGDFNQEDLEAEADKPKLIADLVSTWTKYAAGLKTIVFTVSPKHSLHVTEQYNLYGQEHYGKPIAGHIDGTMDSKERDALISRFAKPFSPSDDSLLIISNYGILLEGFDIGAIAEAYGIEPDEVHCIQMARPTLSLSLYLQIVGRGSRPAPGKEHYILLDHAGNVMRHGYPNSQHKWSLRGSKSPESTVIQCENCGYLWDRSEIDIRPHFCNCGHLVLPEIVRQPREKGEMDVEAVIDTKQELVELDLPANVMGFLSREQSQSYHPAYDWLINQKPTHEELTQIAKIKQYKDRWVVEAWKKTVMKHSRKNKSRA